IRIGRVIDSPAIGEDVVWLLEARSQRLDLSAAGNDPEHLAVGQGVGGAIYRAIHGDVHDTREDGDRLQVVEPAGQGDRCGDVRPQGGDGPADGSTIDGGLAVGELAL